MLVSHTGGFSNDKSRGDDGGVDAGIGRDGDVLGGVGGVGGEGGEVGEVGPDLGVGG